MNEEQLSEMNSSMSDSDDVIHEKTNEILNMKRSRENSDIDSVDVQQSKKNRYHRHTPNQIQELEAFFKDCPNPNEKQRKELSRELKMESSQVKFWFQNKRNHLKMHHEHQENIQLRTMNEKLRAENTRYRDALINAFCPACGKPPGTDIEGMSFDELQLRIQNAGLKNEINSITAMAAKHVGKPLTNSVAPSSSCIPSSSTDTNFKELIERGISGKSMDSVL